MQPTCDPRFKIAGKRIQITFDGIIISCIEGQSIAAAILANNIKAFRQDKNGNDRGVFCGMGVCFECMVNIAGQGDSRACLTPVQDGMQIKSSRYLCDLSSTDGSLLQSTGNNRADSNLANVRHTDVAVIGAGPAGLTAASELQDAGISVLVVDERPVLGGQYFKPLASSFKFSHKPTDRQYAEGTALIEKLRSGRTELLLSTTVFGAEKLKDDSIKLVTMTGARCVTILCKRLILATGAYEAPCIFPGWTLPGVMSTGATQSLLRSYRTAPGQKIIIAGNGPLNLQVAAELVESGANVVAVIESAPFMSIWRAGCLLRGAILNARMMAQGLQFFYTLSRARIPIYSKHHIISATGKSNVNSVAIAPFKKTKSGGTAIDYAAQKNFSADTVCLGYGFFPNNELARLLGCRFHYNPIEGREFPIRTADGRTTEHDVFLIGDSAQFAGAQAALAEGKLAAMKTIEDFTGSSNSDSRESLLTRKLLRRHQKFQKVLWSLFKAPNTLGSLATNDTIVCRCENVSLGQLNQLIDTGITDLGEIKRQSRIAMGRCQGRYCARFLVRWLSEQNFSPHYPHYAVQIPIKPLPIATYNFEVPEWKGYKPNPVYLPETITNALDPVKSPARAPSSKKVPATASHAGPIPTTKVDSLIIGAGVVGTACALFLAQRGLETLLVDAGKVNGQASGANAGSLHLQSLSFDFESSQQPQDSLPLRTLTLQQRGIELWKELEQQLSTDFHLVTTGGLMVAESNDEMRFLERKTAAENELGIKVRLCSGIEARRLEPALSSRIVGASFCPGEGKIDPLRATPKLAEAFVNFGGKLKCDTRVLAIERRSAGFIVNTTNGTVWCKYLINAAGAWSADVAALAGVKLPVQCAPQQMLITEPVQPICSRLLAHAGRHLTMKQSANGNLIIGGGWFAGGGGQTQRARPLTDAIAGNLWVAQRVLPAIASCSIIRSWAAAGVMIDGAPILGESAQQRGFYHAVGANGYTMGTIMGKVTADLITEKASELDITPFSIDRFE